MRIEGEAAQDDPAPEHAGAGGQQQQLGQPALDVGQLEGRGEGVHGAVYIR